MDEPEWVSAHVFHQGDSDALIADAIGPLVEDLLEKGLADSWFFLRHWEGGLHVRLRVRCGRHVVEPVRARITDRCGPYLAAHPSQHRLTEDQYADSAAKLSLLEGSADYQRTLGEPDGIAFVPYRRDQAGNDIGPASDALEQHFHDASRLALDLLRASPDDGYRDTAAFAQLLLAWFTAEPGLGALASKVAAQATPPDPPRGSARLWQAAVDRRYQVQRQQLFGIATRMHALALSRPAPTTGAFPEWLVSLRQLREAVVDAGQGGADVLPVLDRCAHLACNRIGVALTEESYLRMLAARTVRNLAGRAA